MNQYSDPRLSKYKCQKLNKLYKIGKSENTSKVKKSTESQWVSFSCGFIYIYIDGCRSYYVLNKMPKFQLQFDDNNQIINVMGDRVKMLSKIQYNKAKKLLEYYKD